MPDDCVQRRGELRAAVQNLVQRKMVAYDGEDTDDPTDNDLIKITPHCCPVNKRIDSVG
jgi:hypothetical protein